MSAIFENIGIDPGIIIIILLIIVIILLLLYHLCHRLTGLPFYS